MPMDRNIKVGVGTKLYGFCNGYFGRDSYEDKRIIAMGEWNGSNWIVAATDDNKVLFAEGFDQKLLEEWTVEDTDDGTEGS